MTHFNNTNDISLYPTNSASGEFDGYPFPNQISATEEANGQGYGTYADCWNMAGLPGPMAGSPTNPWAASTHGEYHYSPKSIGVLRVGLQSR